MKIQKLPAEARSKLQSGVRVTDAVQCVIELVHNSLDAEATGIAVLIDLKKYRIKVIDNGKGIGKDDLEYVGERFMTSKYQKFTNMEMSFPSYGYSGQALSSLQDVSRSLTIETKAEGGPSFVKVFQKNRALPIREIESERNGTGTTVTIEGFMYAMPVRRIRINEVFDLEEIKNQLQCLALIHYNVCFTLKNENKGVILLQTPQATSILESVKNLFGKKVANSLTTMHHQDKKYEVTGFLSIQSQTQNSLQLVYVNKRIIAKGAIHKFVNNFMKEYSRKQSLFSDTPTNQIFKSLKTCHNVFIVIIKCPRLLCDLFMNVRKTSVEFKNWTDVLKCVHRAVKGAYKQVLNSDSSSSRQDEPEADKEQRRGPSVLVNAVKGASVKRELHCKRDSKKRKKLKGFLQNDNSNEESNQVVNKHDSFESPIPKKCLKLVKTNCNLKTGENNQSFVEFYKWIKTKLESDRNAFMLYNDFLKSKVNYPLKASEMKSPVLGGKLKKKGVQETKKKQLETSRKNVVAAFTALDEELEVVRRNQLKIFPNSRLRVKRGVQFTAEMRSDLTGSLKLGSVRSEVFETQSSRFTFKKPEDVAVVSEVECNTTSSEVQFTNVIKFRNLSESFFQHQPQTQIVLSEKKCDSMVSYSWLSHYQDFVSQNAGREKRYVPPEILQRDDGFVDFSTPPTKVRDVGIQVEVFPAQKVSVMVQTSQPETPNSENNVAVNQDVPDPDFWNTSEYMELERVASLKFASDMKEKNSTSTEFICGQKSQSSSKTHNERNTTKETQTIAAIWTDSLTEMGFPSENPDANKSSSGDTQLPKTIPNEEIERDVSLHTEPGFCLTERHDFVPKGLSPEFINPEITKITELTPREKSKVKLAVDNAQNEMLANVKWQDESTGDCLKPKMPDGVLFEMNRSSVKNYGDEVLSAALSYCAMKVHNLLHSFTFTKELLSEVEILGQLDKKFIATTIRITAPKKMELISLFDQHAVDERIKLEELINENISPDGIFLSSCLNPPVECKLPESDVRVAAEFREKFWNFGLSVEPVDENIVSVTRAPSFLLNKHEKDLKSKKETSLSDVLKCLIVNILQEVTETRGAGAKIPKVLHNAFCLEACHKAIKFNKPLTIEKMTEMINKLQSCTLPFQCAHGRPSVIPIIDLEDFKPEMEERENIDLKKLKRFINERKEDDIIENSETLL